MDQYSLCPCGSGKKFKWCCHDIHGPISRAFQLDEEGQHAAALKEMAAVAAQHPDRPEAHGQYALLLFKNEQPDEAEKELEKAFAVDPNYAYGHVLKARFRLFEGEAPGALMLMRKAAELYHPDSHSILAQVYVDIFDLEMKLSHPLAAHAAIRLALRHDPANQSLSEGLEQVFGPNAPGLLPTARQFPVYKPCVTSDAEVRKLWETALAPATKLEQAVAGFTEITRKMPNEPAAWYNLGISQGWLGKNSDAIDSLEKYVQHEADEEKAAAAWRLAEVLLMGRGVEDRADVVGHVAVMSIQQPEAFLQHLESLRQSGTLAGLSVDQEQQVLTGMLLQEPTASISLTPTAAPTGPRRIAATLTVLGPILRLAFPSKERLQSAVTSLRSAVGDALSPPEFAVTPATSTDLVFETVVMQSAASPEDAKGVALRGATEFLEGEWLNRPRKSLGGATLVDSAGHPNLRKKVRAILDLTHEALELIRIPYDMDRIRRKLGLLKATPAEAGTSAAGVSAEALEAMSAADLALVSPEGLSPDLLDAAFQASLRLDAKEIAEKFAQSIVGGKPQPEKPDRWPYHAFLIQLASERGEFDEAIQHVDAGMRDDCENNGGVRRNDFELRRGQILVKRGDIAGADQVFDSLIARAPAEGKFRIAACEAMLGKREGARAARFAEAGIADAKQRGNRDLEGAFLELRDQARRFGG